MQPAVFVLPSGKSAVVALPGVVEHHVGQFGQGGIDIVHVHGADPPEQDESVGPV